jgi:hypothetical protein
MDYSATRVSGRKTGLSEKCGSELLSKSLVRHTDSTSTEHKKLEVVRCVERLMNWHALLQLLEPVQHRIDLD